jgi:hypothetical protein
MKPRTNLFRASIAVASAAAMIVVPTLLADGADAKASAIKSANAHHTSELARAGHDHALRAPAPAPTTRPTEPSGYDAPTSLTTASSSLETAALSGTFEAAAAPASARTWGKAGATTSTLVLYDTTNTYGWLGELYAIAGGNLASHFGQITAEPVVD